jgi:hypothetical protein
VVYVNYDVISQKWFFFCGGFSAGRDEREEGREEKACTEVAEREKSNSAQSLTATRPHGARSANLCVSVVI